MTETTLPVPEPARYAHLQRALRPEYLTVGWNVVEGLIAVTAALAAGSVALLGFGIDSFVESASGIVLVSRLRSETFGRAHEAVERLDRRAHRLVRASLFLLAAYIVVDASVSLWRREAPTRSLVGIVLTIASIGVMLSSFAAAGRTSTSAARTFTWPQTLPSRPPSFWPASAFGGPAGCGSILLQVSSSRP